MWSSNAVTYVCNPTTGQLRRYWGYGIVDPQPIPPAGGSNALLRSNVAACSFTMRTPAPPSGRAS